MVGLEEGRDMPTNIKDVKFRKGCGGIQAFTPILMII